MAVLAGWLLLDDDDGAGPLARGLVACTGAQFCGIGLVETKNRALRMVEALEGAYDIPQTVRMHWSGCPNSCGQSQVGSTRKLASTLEAGREGERGGAADVLWCGGGVMVRWRTSA